MTMPLELFVDHRHDDGDARIGSCTVVGPRDEVASLVQELKDKGIVQEGQIKKLVD